MRIILIVMKSICQLKTYFFFALFVFALLSIECSSSTPIAFDLSDLDGKWSKGLSSEVDSSVSIEVDYANGNLHYHYTTNDCFSSFDTSGNLKSPPEKDPNLDFHISEWRDVQKTGGRIQFIGKIRYGSFKHGALKAKNGDFIPSNVQISIRDAVENAKLSPQTPSQINDVSPPSNAIYAFVSIKKLSTNTFDIFIWGSPDITANAPTYNAPSSPEYLAEKKLYPDAQDEKCEDIYLVEKSWVGFSDTPDKFAQTTYSELRSLALKYGGTTKGVYTRVRN